MPMLMDMALSTDEFAAALGEQVTCYRRLLRLSGAQHECVAQGQTDKLLDILQGRQRELEKITEIEARIRPLKRDWPAVAESLDADERASAEALLAESRSLLAEITRADQDDALVLQQRKLSLGRQLAQANVGRAVNRSYAAAAYGRPGPRMDVHK